MADPDAAVQELLRDAFTRLIEHVDDLTGGLTDEVSAYRPTPSANSIAWLLWHSARVQDIQLAHVAGVEQVWTRDGWVDRFGLDLPRDDTGYGHGADEVARNLLVYLGSGPTLVGGPAGEPVILGYAGRQLFAVGVLTIRDGLIVRIDATADPSARVDRMR